MTLAAWLASRTPPSPPELAVHLTQHTRTLPSGDDLTAGLLDAGDAAFACVLESGGETRDAALDLLSADAFVTYAFEAAADDPATLPARADAAMRRISTRAVAHLQEGGA